MPKTSQHRKHIKTSHYEYIRPNFSLETYPCPSACPNIATIANIDSRVSIYTAIFSLISLIAGKPVRI